ncbi:MAG: DUF2493 domain-containing protein [Candidatus Poseidoniaceae archaeon]|nr:DUF2493 domain-containing protein [Candidatus Poseidoniaceae archaeon]
MFSIKYHRRIPAILTCFLALNVNRRDEAYRIVNLLTAMDADDNTGAATAQRLAGKDLNKSGKVVNLVICGNSRFYDFEWLEEQLDQWIEQYEYPDLIIMGGASGIDLLAERWCDNLAIPMAIYNEAWNAPRSGLQDDGRPEAAPTLVDDMLNHATHVLAFPGPKSKWTSIMIKRARERGIAAVEVPTPLEM